MGNPIWSAIGRKSVTMEFVSHWSTNRTGVQSWSKNVSVLQGLEDVQFDDDKAHEECDTSVTLVNIFWFVLLSNTKLKEP